MASVVAVILGLLSTALGGALLLGVPEVRSAPPSESLNVSPNVPITAMDTGLGVANNSPRLLADPAEPRFVVLANRLDAPDFSCALEVSGDGGSAWLPVNPVPVLPSGAEKCYAPEVAFDADGTLYYLFVGLSGPGNEPVGAYLTTSEDRGQTFSEPQQVLGPRNFAVRMAIDASLGESGRVHLVWLNATSDPPLGGFGPPPNPILTAHSDDGGRTFSQPVQVSDPAREHVVAPALSLGPDHGVHVAYYDLGRDARDYKGLDGPAWEGTWSIVLASSSNGGLSFTPGVVVDEEVVPSERVMLIFTMPPPALTADGPRVCAAWTDARHGDDDALLRCSSDDGRSWGEVQRLNDDPLGNGLRQYMPQLSWSPDGRLDAIFLDRRADPQNVLNDVSYTYSIDGGRRFAPNAKLSSQPSDSRIGQQYVGVAAEGLVEFGSRLGLLASENTVVAAWPDTRNSRGGTTGQDLFGSAVTLPPAGQPGWARALGVVLIGGGVLALIVGSSRRRRTHHSALVGEAPGQDR